MIAQLIGAAPRYLGSKEECKFIQKYLGSESKLLSKIWPYATTIKTSAFSAFKVFIVSRLVHFFGWSIGILFSKAKFLTGDAVDIRPRPFGWSGWVTTNWILWSDL